MELVKDAYSLRTIKAVTRAAGTYDTGDPQRKDMAVLTM